MSDFDRDSLLEEIRSLLPDPVQDDTQLDGDVVLVGGDPGEVVVRIRGGKVSIAVFSVRWEGPHTPVVRPKQLATLNWKRLIEFGRAQCVLGNHDLNILLDHLKHDNGWFYGDEFLVDGEVVPQILADDSIRQQVLDFFRKLPVALERDDLRVVHACWNDAMIDIARESLDPVELYTSHHELIENGFPDLDLDDIGKGLEHQNKNPVKRLTSGPEERVEKPIEASGKTRYEKRVHWWNEYHGEFCVFGHYSIPDGDPRGGKAAFCVDYGVGKRWTERRAGKTQDFELKLAALRWPERVVVFDDGVQRAVT